MRKGTPNGARFSDDRKYRYLLWRKWGEGGGPGHYVAFIGLNPSKANEVDSDNTITRLINFAKAWGFDGMRMLNLFALVSTDPRGLARVDDPVGEQNNAMIERIVRRYPLTVCCWGAHRFAASRQASLLPRLREWSADLKCFGRTSPSRLFPGGAPKHPLYLPNKTKLEVFR